jgi:methylglyoxal reductase
MFGAQTIERANAVLADLRPFAEKYRATLAQIVIALTARQPGITHVLVGARNAAQARENAGGGCLELSADDVREMNAIAAGLERVRD